MLAGLERGHRLGIVKKGRSGDVHEVDVVAPQERVDILDIGDPEPRGRGLGRRPVGAGHAEELDALDLREVLEGVQAEASAPDHAETDPCATHR